MFALSAILAHEAMGPEARWRRHTAELLHILASGRRIDPDRTQTYGEILKEIYADPFRKTEQPQTAAEIIGYIGKKLEGLLHGSAEAGREN